MAVFGLRAWSRACHEAGLRSLGLKRKALATYRLFVAAVEQEAATATQARELARAIERAGKRLNGPAER